MTVVRISDFVRLSTVTLVDMSAVFVCANVEERQSILMKALQETPPKSFMESFLELTDWLTNREQSLRTLTFVVNDVDVMDRQITQLKVDKLDQASIFIRPHRSDR